MPLFYQSLDDLLDLRDDLGRPGIVMGAPYVERISLLEKARYVLLCEVLHRHAQSVGRLDDPVLDVREVLDVFDLVAPILQVPPDHIEDYVGHGMPYMAGAVDVGPADIHQDPLAL